MSLTNDLETKPSQNPMKTAVVNPRILAACMGVAACIGPIFAIGTPMLKAGSPGAGKAPQSPPQGPPSQKKIFTNALNPKAISQH